MAALNSAPGQDLPIEGKTVKALTLLSMKRAHDLFSGNHGEQLPVHEERCASAVAHLEMESTT